MKSWSLTLFTRADCCLCDEMKSVVRRVARTLPLALEEIDVDSSPALQQEYGSRVPLLLINGRVACKYRTTERQLRRRLRSAGPSSAATGESQ